VLLRESFQETGKSRLFHRQDGGVDHDRDDVHAIDRRYFSPDAAGEV